MHTFCAPQSGTICLRSTPSGHLRPSCPSHVRSMRVSAAQGRQQQQQQQQQQPISNYRHLMQQYKSIVLAAPASSQKSTSSKASSAGSSKDTKGAPRLKPAKQSSAPSGTGSKRTAAAAAGATNKSKSGGFGAAAELGSGAAAKLRAQSSSRRERTEDSISTSSRSSNSSSSSSRSSDSSKSSDSSSKVSSTQRPAVHTGWILPSNGKGFGSPVPTAAAAAAPAAADRKGSEGDKTLKVFRFGVESSAVSKAIEACGWQGRLSQVESIKGADLILAAKCSSTGKHRNLAQGRKAASNAGIPFVVVGRKLSPESFRQALIPYVEPNSKEAAALAAAAAAAVEVAAANKANADAFFASAGRWGRGP